MRLPSRNHRATLMLRPTTGNGLGAPGANGHYREDVILAGFWERENPLRVWREREGLTGAELQRTRQ
jgi:hypothetical protein